MERSQGFGVQRVGSREETWDLKTAAVEDRQQLRTEPYERARAHASTAHRGSKQPLLQSCSGIGQGMSHDAAFGSEETL